MGEARRRGEAKGLVVVRPAVRQVILNIPVEMRTDIELRHSVVAAQYPSQQDFLLGLIAAGINFFDQAFQRQQDARASQAAAQEQMRTQGAEPKDCDDPSAEMEFADEGGEG